MKAGRVVCRCGWITRGGKLRSGTVVERYRVTTGKVTVRSVDVVPPPARERARRAQRLFSPERSPRGPRMLQYLGIYQQLPRICDG